MKRTLALILVLLLSIFALGEEVLNVNGISFSRGEADAFTSEFLDSYRDVADYYRDYLGVDFWALSYPDGVSVWESVRRDAREQLVMLGVYLSMAGEKNVTLSAEEKDAALQSAGSAFSLLADPGFSREDMEALYLKRAFGDKVLALLLADTDVDEEAVKNGVDPENYVLRGAEFLCIPYYVYYGSEESRRAAEETLLSLAADEDFGDGHLKEHPEVVKGSFTVGAPGTDDGGLSDAARGLREGEVSGVVSTQLGLFTVRLTGETDTAPYEEAVRDALNAARRDAFSGEVERLYESADCVFSSAYWSTAERG